MTGFFYITATLAFNELMTELFITLWIPTKQCFQIFVAKNKILQKVIPDCTIAQRYFKLWEYWVFAYSIQGLCTHFIKTSLRFILCQIGLKWAKACCKALHLRCFQGVLATPLIHVYNHIQECTDQIRSYESLPSSILSKLINFCSLLKLQKTIDFLTILRGIKVN